MNYTIRKLKPSESKKYREIRLEALREYPEYFGSNYNKQAKMEKLYFERIVEDNSPRGIMVGAFTNDELIGICGVTFETKLIPEAGELIQMYVKRNHQGNKIAQKLVKKIFEEVKQRKNIRILVLGVKTSNVSAIKTYYNCGFKLNREIEYEEGTQFMTLLI